MAGDSPEKPVRRRREEARPSELKAAALQLFIEKGYAATRLDDVAVRAGVVKGTLYLYFDSKEAPFNAVVREGLVSALSEWKERLANYAGSSPDLLRSRSGFLTGGRIRPSRRLAETLPLRGWKFFGFSPYL